MTEQQRMAALKTAKARQVARGQLHQRVRAVRTFRGSCDELAEILAAGVPACMQGMRIEEALRWVRRPPATFDQFVFDTLEQVGCTEWKLLGDLTLRQRAALVRELRWCAHGDLEIAA